VGTQNCGKLWKTVKGHGSEAKMASPVVGCRLVAYWANGEVGQVVLCYVSLVKGTQWTVRGQKVSGEQPCE
jgi:hypothetical protein